MYKKCKRCELKAPRTGTSYCDRCMFDMKNEFVMSHLPSVVIQQMKLDRAVRRAEVLRESKRRQLNNQGRNRVRSYPPEIQEKNHEITYLTSSQIRMGERYTGASIALDRFIYLRDRNIAGLRLNEKVNGKWKLVEEFNGHIPYPTE